MVPIEWPWRHQQPVHRIPEEVEDSQPKNGKSRGRPFKNELNFVLQKLTETVAFHVLSFIRTKHPYRSAALLACNIVEFWNPNYVVASINNF